MGKYNLAQIISELRSELGLSLEDIAKKTNLHRTTIGLIERGERAPTVENASKIAKALGKPLAELLLMQEANDLQKMIKVRRVKEECIRNEDALLSINLSPEVLIKSIEHCYNTLDIIDEQLLNNNAPALGELVELANFSSIIGNLLGSGLADNSNGVYLKNKPHTYPDLIRVDGTDTGIEIKMALERNSPKGHLPKEGYYLTFRYVLTSSEGSYDKMNRGNTASIWEVRCGYLELTDFSESNTSGDSGKTATITTDAQKRMSLVYFDPSLVPYVHTEKKAYPYFN